MDPAAVAILAALVGAGSSIAATALTMWWSGRHDATRQSREEAASLRAEKRIAYRDLIQALDAWREVTVEIADGERKRRDWDAYWEAREACMKSGASLQLVGTDDMIEAAGEAMEFLLDVSWKFQTHTALAFGDHPPSPAEISHSVWVHIEAADREEATLLDLMRVDLGFAPLTRPRPTPPSATQRTDPPKS
jgi:hypothetical protein